VSIQVSYLNEALPGDTVLLYRHYNAEQPGKVFIKGIREKNQDAIFTAMLEIQPSQEL
jgi:hypothetical protein